MKNPLLIAHAFSTAFMTGLIWFVQVVHYPMFADVGRDTWTTYEAIHQRLTTWVVAPVMLVELAAACLLLLDFGGDSIDRRIVWSGLGLLAVIWISTAMLQVPAHNRLQQEWSDSAYRWLVNSNWIRTVAWTARSGLAFWLIARRLP